MNTNSNPKLKPLRKHPEIISPSSRALFPMPGSMILVKLLWAFRPEMMSQ